MSQLFCAFDIDGTLVRLEAEEERIFGHACLMVMGAAAPAGGLPRLKWREFPVVTDTGIVATLWERVLGRAPSTAEVAAVRDQHVAGLKAFMARQPDAFLQIQGARAVLAALAGRVGLATGNSAPAAVLKLAHAGLGDLDLPLATAEDGPERVAVVQTCARRLGVPQGARLVSIGDGVWDVAAARQLGLPFVGVAANTTRATALRKAGAGAVVSDFRDLSAVLSLLKTAPVPG